MTSLVIRTYNEEKYLRWLLDSVRNQSYKDYEIIIVDSGSTDSTLELVKDFDCKVVTIKKSEFTFGRSLNYGCEVAQGEFLVFISAHCIPYDNYWLEHLVGSFTDDSVALVYGRQVGYKTSKFSEHQVFRKYFPPESANQQGGFFCNNANSAIRRSLWKTHPFNEELTGLEDMSWAKYHYYNNHKIVYQPNSSVIHIHEETWRKVKIRYEREAYALKEIMPEIHFEFKDFIRAFFRGINNDIGAAIKSNKFPGRLFEIVLFRFCQFYGAYKGNHLHRKISNSKKQRYFYP